MTKSFSKKSNAIRAARAAGLPDVAAVPGQNGLWIVSFAVPSDGVDELASDDVPVVQIEAIAEPAPVAVKKARNFANDDAEASPNAVAARNAARVAAKSAMQAKPAVKAPSKSKKAAPIQADAAVVLPTPPDFTANTHKPYRKKLEALVALVSARDVDGLRAFVINATSTSPKALVRYRDRAIQVLTGKAA